MVAFNPDIEWMLPEGDVPYMPNEAPEGTEHTMLTPMKLGAFHNYCIKKLVHLVLPINGSMGILHINDARREMMFIQLLEGLSAP